MKKLANLKGAKALNKTEQKSINGGAKFLCYPGTDSECCGSEQWQCGTGPNSGGYIDGSYNGHPLCACV